MGRIIDIYQKFAGVVYAFVLLLTKALCVIMIVSVSYAVAGRFILHATPRWCEEVGILSMIWVCFLSASLAIRDGNHIRMTILEYVLPRKAVKALHILAYIVLLSLSAIWIYAGWDVVQLTRMTRMPSTRLPMAVSYASVFVSGILGVIMSLSRLLRGGW